MRQLQGAQEINAASRMMYGAIFSEPTAKIMMKLMDEVYDYDQLLVIGAFEGPEIVAAATMELFRPLAAVEIKALAVDGRYRGQGFGRQIIAAAEQTARNQAARTISLIPRRDSIGFYVHM